MKNLFKVIFLIALAASCAKEIGTETATPEVSRRYYISFDQQTKTSISGTGSKRQVNWTAGDRISYYTEPNQSAPVTATVKLEDEKASISVPGGSSDVFINAVYGAGQLNSASSTVNTMYVSSPARNSQAYTSFADAHICAAFSDDIENPNLTFHNVAAILKFTSAATVSKVVFYGNSAETITGGDNGNLKITHAGGTLTVAPSSTGGSAVTIQTNGAESDFYLAILPVKFSSGITIDCYDSSMELIVSQKTTNAINAISSTGAPKILDLGSAQDWIANAHPKVVDLGLPSGIKWASCNVGATKPEEYGDYFAWGETDPKSDYSWSAYKFELGSDENGPFSKYVNNSSYGTVDNKSVLDPEDDAAIANWGDSWRMPTDDEWTELRENCTWTWTDNYEGTGIAGKIGTSKVSGYEDKSIFFPAAGYRDGTGRYIVGSNGGYWSSSIITSGIPNPRYTYFSSTGEGRSHYYRYRGFSVRPVFGEFIPVSSITLDKSSIEMAVGWTAQLSATISPSNATVPDVRWESEDYSIVVVGSSGGLLAKAKGTTKITAYSSNGLSASCTVTVTTKPKDTEAVDLGLSVKWAPYNVGAAKPEEYGDYFAWGEAEPKSSTYSWSTYKFELGTTKDGPFSKYVTDSRYGTVDNKSVLDPEDDAAIANWGGSWRMPTDAEWTELKENCTWTWTSDYNGTGIAGRIGTSKVSGYTDKSIFLPAAGYRGGTNLMNVGTYGNYWSSSLYSVESYYAWRGYFYADGFFVQSGYRSFGYPIRPVFGEFIPVSSITLDNSPLKLVLGKTVRLSASISPSNASAPSVRWVPKDDSIVSVDSEGNITARAVGSTTITAYSSNGLSASCVVTVIDLSKPDSAGAVDLGLPSGVKWASCNVGATKPEGYGEYFAWGETAPKSVYNWTNYKFELGTGKDGPFSKYVTSSSYGTVDNKSVLDAEDDAARVNWGGSWRMPTRAEHNELRDTDNCTWVWTTQNGINGYRVTSKKNGNSIFLPAAGYRSGSSLGDAGASGYYWSSSLHTDNTNRAYSLYLISSSFDWRSYYRYYGQSVRPVTE